MDSGTATQEKNESAVVRIEVRALSICDRAKVLRIVDDEGASEASAFLNFVINPLIKEGDELFDPMIASAYQTHQMAIATKRKAVGGLPVAKQLIRAELGRYAQIIEDRARAERLRIEREAREADARRLELELEAVEAMSIAPAEMAAEVAAIMEAPRAMTLPPPAVGFMSIPGARDVYSAVVVNLKLLCAAIGVGEVPVSLIDANQGNLNRRAASDKEGFNIPGCRLEKTKSVSSKRSY